MNKTPKYTVTHCIFTTGSPIHCRARRLGPDKLRIARNEFEHVTNKYNLSVIKLVVVGTDAIPNGKSDAISKKTFIAEQQRVYKRSSPTEEESCERAKEETVIIH